MGEWWVYALVVGGMEGGYPAYASLVPSWPYYPEVHKLAPLGTLLLAGGHAGDHAANRRE